MEGPDVKKKISNRDIKSLEEVGHERCHHAQIPQTGEVHAKAGERVKQEAEG